MNIDIAGSSIIVSLIQSTNFYWTCFMKQVSALQMETSNQHTHTHTIPILMDLIVRVAIALACQYFLIIIYLYEFILG